MSENSISNFGKPLSVNLVGTWELVSRVDYSAAGNIIPDPVMGSDPVALLVYDHTGHFTAQFMKRDRQSVPESEPTVSGLNNSRAMGGYDAYFGLYTVDDGEGTVTQQLTGSLSSENVGQVLTRAMTVEGDELTISLETTSVTGEAVTRILKWRRVG